MRNTTSIGFLAVMLALAGCDNGGGNTDTDSGMTDMDGGVTGDPDSGTNTGDPDSGTNTGDPDSGTNTGDPDSGTNTGEACEGARTIALEMGEQTITGNTTGMSSDLTLGCADPNAHEVLALTVPGTGPKGIVFSLAIDGTSEDFDTIVEARVGSCESSTEPMCYDDIESFFNYDVRSQGLIMADGGQTINFIVTGYSEADVGAWAAAIEVADATPPTFTGGEVLRVAGARYDFLIDGGDADGDAIGIRYTFLDESGAAIGVDYDDDGSPDQSEFDWYFDQDLSGETSFNGALVRDEDSTLVAGTITATQVEIAVLDRFGLTSSSMTLPVRDVTEVGLDQPCGTDAVCVDGLECASGTCALPADVVAACTTAAASARTLTPGSEETFSATLELGSGLFRGSCSDTGGAEHLYVVTVPAPVAPAVGYDLIATTANDGTDPETDTIVYVQSACGDPSTELVCADDISYPDDARSTAVLEDAAAGDHTVIVELWEGVDASASYQLGVSLRPVLGAGEACDPTGAENRCSTGACPAGDSPVCPDAPAP